jgi:hypothetical protein
MSQTFEWIDVNDGMPPDGDTVVLVWQSVSGHLPRLDKRGRGKNYETGRDETLVLGAAIHEVDERWPPPSWCGGAS